ncbi:MAG: phosphohydrolase [Lentisphaerae bacterium RIFOXYC12_FULL_60_16]|nr:MAG: phosphohydrolase [Lentisphaerae bacterium RIFOXYC12_FULL_60_16]OGV73632.1 MAG: phosphohydrolase [Lentisphaerae bacterium RIFOXYA12_FULL_60_10]OGV81524.1 MAG: phosphohydrolase [Lentisphaerae bacterium RIFOXYB12_FULL_60_10]
MKYLRVKLTRALVAYFGGDDRRIEHALCVLQQVDRLIDAHPGCDPDIAVASALLHDVGIKVSEEKLGYNNGKTQEEYGPVVAGDMLRNIGFPADKLDVVTKIIGNHHSPSRYDYPELALLKEADRNVNRQEELQHSPDGHPATCVEAR